MLETFNLSLASFKETSEPEAFLCSVCVGQTTKVLKLRDEINKIDENIEEKISSLTIIDGTAVHSRKRSSSSSNSTGKKARLVVNQPVTTPNAPVATPLITTSSVTVPNTATSSNVESPSVSVSVPLFEL